MPKWFQRKGESITTPTEEKKDSPDGLWHLCPKCKVMVDTEEHKAKMKAGREAAKAKKAAAPKND